MNTPSDWSVDRLKWSMARLFNVTWGDEPNGVDDIICVRVADFDRTRFAVVDAPPTLRAVDAKERANRLLRQGDLLIEKSGGGDNQPVGCVVDFDHTFDAVCSNFIGRIPIASGMWPRYWTYVHASLYSYRLNVPAIKQTTGIQNLDTDAYFNQRVPFPPRQEQRAIAIYLDRETARLDALVAAKERVLGLLAEKRRVLITRAVTRGLDPRAPLRDSGIPWLGEIPAHWNTSKFTWSVFIAEGQVDPEVEPYVNMPLIAPNHVETGTGMLLRRETAADQGAISGKYLCKQGDVIYSKIRPALRKATIAIEECLCSADMYPLRARDHIQAEFLLLFLLSEPFSIWAVLESTRVAMPKINREALSEIRIPIPPLEEQRLIVAHIQEATARLDGVRAATEGSIALLKERRVALIAAAVTGKIHSQPSIA